MPAYPFVQVDVFTEQPFGGNPLAVFHQAQGLSDAQMQQLAREMNLSETAFVLPTEISGADFKVRIFTPAKELPFAGHPVVGTHWALARLGRVPLQAPLTTVRFELGVGVLPADLHVADGQVQRVVMTQDRPRFLEILDDLALLAQGLGLSPAAMADTGWPVQVVSTGVPQMMVPVRSLAEVQALQASSLDTNALGQVCQAMETECVLVFSLETAQPDYDVHVRLFAPMLGVPEDPATGSANGALGAYLVQHGILPASTPTRIRSEQGSEMGRPSTIHIEVDQTQDQITAVRVGGEVVQVAEGIVHF